MSERIRQNYGNLLGQYFITLWYFKHEINKSIEYEFNCWASVDRFENNKPPISALSLRKKLGQTETAAVVAAAQTAFDGAKQLVELRGNYPNLDLQAIELDVEQLLICGEFSREDESRDWKRTDAKGEFTAIIQANKPIVDAISFALLYNATRQHQTDTASEFYHQFLQEYLKVLISLNTPQKTYFEGVLSQLESEENN